jgi:hypothetical protein
MSETFDQWRHAQHNDPGPPPSADATEAVEEALREVRRLEDKLAARVAETQQLRVALRAAWRMLDRAREAASMSSRQSNSAVHPPQRIALCLDCMHWWNADGGQICPDDRTENRDHPVAFYGLTSWRNAVPYGAPHDCTEGSE